MYIVEAKLHSQSLILNKKIIVKYLIHSEIWYCKCAKFVSSLENVARKEKDENS